MKLRLLSQQDVRQTLGMAQAIELMAEAFTSLSSGAIDAPVRTSLSNDAGTMLYKPASLPTQRMFGLKIVSTFPGNAAQKLPVTTGLMIVNDSATGLPVALMDAQYLTALRTGAAAGLATRVLANPDTTVAALFGTGGQAVCQLRALLAVLPLETVYVFSRCQEWAESFCQTQATLVGDCRLVATASTQVLRDCGVISTATTSKVPLFADEELSAGTHLNGIGSYTPAAAEIPPHTVARAEVVVDQRAAALKEAGDLLQPIAQGLLPEGFAPAELGEVLLGTRAGRSNREQTTFFKSVGNAAQDIVCAAAVLRHAEQNGVGRIVEL